MHRLGLTVQREEKAKAKGVQQRPPSPALPAAAAAVSSLTGPFDRAAGCVTAHTSASWTTRPKSSYPYTAQRCVLSLVLSVIAYIAFSGCASSFARKGAVQHT